MNISENLQISGNLYVHCRQGTKCSTGVLWPKLKMLRLRDLTLQHHELKVLISTNKATLRKLQVASVCLLDDSDENWD